jgi:hypothetical protein
MRGREDMEATQKELERRHAEREALERFHRQERRRRFWRTMPRNLAIIAAAIIAIWALKSCES